MDWSRPRPHPHIRMSVDQLYQTWTSLASTRCIFGWNKPCSDPGAVHLLSAIGFPELFIGAMADLV